MSAVERIIDIGIRSIVKRRFYVSLCDKSVGCIAAMHYEAIINKPVASKFVNYKFMVVKGAFRQRRRLKQRYTN